MRKLREQIRYICIHTYIYIRWSWGSVVRLVIRLRDEQSDVKGFPLLKIAHIGSGNHPAPYQMDIQDI